jgi:hypothetical protein
MTEITIILDRSGSMESIANDAIGGFNTYLKQQQAQGGDARLTHEGTHQVMEEMSARVSQSRSTPKSPKPPKQ